MKLCKGDSIPLGERLLGKKRNKAGRKKWNVTKARRSTESRKFKAPSTRIRVFLNPLSRAEKDKSVTSMRKFGFTKEKLRNLAILILMQPEHIVTHTDALQPFFLSLY